MAKRSQKSRFGPGKDRIKPDTEGATVDESDDESNERDESADESGDESEGQEPGKGNKSGDSSQDGGNGQSKGKRGKAGKSPGSASGDKATQDEHTARDGETGQDGQAEETGDAIGKGAEQEAGPNEKVGPDADSGSAPSSDSDDELATGYTSAGDEQNPQTCCSNCQTVFEVSQDLLSSSDTRVRCGECLSIFDALANLRERKKAQPEQSGIGPESAESDADAEPVSSDEPNSPMAAADVETGSGPASGPESGPESGSAAGTTSPLDVTYTDFSLFSSGASLPDIDYLDETREIQPFDYDDLGEEDEFDETIDETLYAEDVIDDARAAQTEDARRQSADSKAGTGDGTGAGNVARGDKDDADASGFAPAAATLDEIDELLVSLQKPGLPSILEEEPVGAWWIRGLLFLGVLTLAAGLYGYRERDTLQHHPFVRPVLESVCTVFGCVLPKQVDLAALQVTKRTVFSHPDIDDTLIINIGFVNQAQFSQPYPTLEILLTDRNGTLIVKNDFKPADYLDKWREGDVIDVGKRLDISLNMEDPGNKAMSFELDFK